MTAPGDDPELRTDKFERAAAQLHIPILLIRGKLSDVVSPEGVQHFLDTVPRGIRRAVPRRAHRRRWATTTPSPTPSWTSSGG